MACQTKEQFLQTLYSIDAAKQIAAEKEHNRINVWSFTSSKIQDAIYKGVPSVIELIPSIPIQNKITKFVKALTYNKKTNPSSDTLKTFIQDIVEAKESVNDKDVGRTAEFGIVLHEIMESVKGESDKSVKNRIDISVLSDGGYLPHLPAPRVIESIGRKIAYYHGVRFAAEGDKNITPANVSGKYYEVGLHFTELVEKAGYITITKANEVSVIKDFEDNRTTGKVVGKKEKTQDTTTRSLKTIAINLDKFISSDSDISTTGLSTKNAEAKVAARKKLEREGVALYFTDRTDTDITGTVLGDMVNTLKIIANLSIPAKVLLPSKTKLTSEERKVNDSKHAYTPTPTLKETQQTVEDNPLSINSSLTSFLELLHEEGKDTSKSGSEILSDLLNKNPTQLMSLFGVKAADKYAKDKQESVSGQNSSKTTPLNDLIEFLGEIDPKQMYMALTFYRNSRAGVSNSVVDYQASKQMRALVTSGSYTYAVDSESYKRVVSHISEELDMTPSVIMGITTDTNSKKLNEALVAIANFEKATSLKDKVGNLTYMSQRFPNVEFVALVTTLKEIQNIRNPDTKGNITGEMSVSTDATASGGVLTFAQALGLNDDVTNMFQRLNILNTDKDVQPINDIYGIMQEAIATFLSTEPTDLNTNTILNPEVEAINESAKSLFTVLRNDLYNNNLRKLAKPPTMTFIYSQGEGSAVYTLADQIADDITNHLGDTKVQKIVTDLLKDIPGFEGIETKKLTEIEGLHAAISGAVLESGVPKKMYNLMEIEIGDKFLSEYKKRSNSIFKLMVETQTNGFKMMPAHAAVYGNLGEYTKEQLNTHGVPISRIFDVATTDGDNTVFTREQRLWESVLMVSTIHSMDTAQIFQAVYKAVTEKAIKTGVMLIHDDIRTHPELIAEIEVEFIKATKQLMEQFDVHNELLKSMAVYNPKVLNNSNYKKLRADVDASMKAKQEILKDFNLNTTSVIGSDLWTKVPNKLDVDSTVETETETTDVQPDTNKKRLKNAATKLKIIEFVNESDIIRDYLNSSNPAFLEEGSANVFDPETDQITISSVDERRNMEVQDNSTVEGRDNIKTLIEHEITHSFTVGYLQKALAEGNNAKVKYLEKSLFALRDIFTDPIATQQFGEMAGERIRYMVMNGDHARDLNEFISVMSTEPKVAAEVYKALAQDKSKLKAAIEYIKTQAKRFISSITQKDLDADYVDVAKLKGAINGVISEGFSEREADKETFIKYQKTFYGTVGAGPKVVPTAFSLNYLNYAASSMLTTKVERSAITLAKSTNVLLANTFPMYNEAMNKLHGVYDDSKSLQQLVQVISNVNIDALKKNKILSLFSQFREERNALIGVELGKFAKAMEGVSKSESDDLYNFIHKTPLHDYFVLAGGITTEEGFDKRIKLLENQVTTSVSTQIDNIVYLRTEYEMKEDTALRTNSVYNLDTTISSTSQSANAEAARELLALKSIKALGTDKFINLLNKSELMTVVKDNSVANKLSTLSHGSASLLNDSLVPEYYADRPQTKVISFNDIQNNDYPSKDGWKILRMPTQKSLGVAYRAVIDSTYLEGAFTDIKLASSDVNVPAKFNKYKDVVRTNSGNKLVLKDSEKLTLGLVKNPAEGLVRGTAHSLAIQDSQVIRDELIKRETRFTVTTDSDKARLLDVLTTEGSDNPWFVKAPLDMYAKLNSNKDKKIKSVYMPISKLKQLSDVGGFNEEVTWVRKDIAYWLVGDKAASLGPNPAMQWAIRLTKTVIAASKIGMVITNPAKIAVDNSSNIAYLGARGMSPIQIGKSYHTIMKEFSEYSSIKNQLAQLRVKEAASKTPTSAYSKVKTQLEAHPAHGIYERGYVNSLGTDLLNQNKDTLSGMQTDLDKALTYLVKGKKGNNNFIGRFIGDMSRLGFNGEDFLVYVANIVGKADSLKGAEAELKSVAARISQIKSDDDTVAYISQFLVTPTSETVKIGSYATDLSDVLAKESLHRFMIQERNMSVEEATEEVVQSFPDYKENMPLAIKQMSDLGILMFPAFWLRIQKSIYRLAKDQPVNLGLELQIEHMLGTDFETISDANIYNKMNEWGGIINSPHEHLTPYNFLPHNIFNMF